MSHGNDDGENLEFEDTDFPPPHSAVAVFIALAVKHGLISEGANITPQMRDLLADLVETCATYTDDSHLPIVPVRSCCCGWRSNPWRMPVNWSWRMSAAVRPSRPCFGSARTRSNDSRFPWRLSPHDPPALLEIPVVHVKILPPKADAALALLAPGMTEHWNDGV